MKQTIQDVYMQMVATNLILALGYHRPYAVEICDGYIYAQQTNADSNHFSLVVGGEALELTKLRIHNRDQSVIDHEIIIKDVVPIYVKALTLTQILNLSDFLLKVVDSGLLPYIKQISLGIVVGSDASISYNKPMWFIKAYEVLTSLEFEPELMSKLKAQLEERWAATSVIGDGDTATYCGEHRDGINHIYAFERSSDSEPAPKRDVKKSAFLWERADLLMRRDLGVAVTHHTSNETTRTCCSVALSDLVKVKIPNEYARARVVWFVAGAGVDSLGNGVIDSDVDIYPTVSHIDIASFTDTERQATCFRPDDFSSLKEVDDAISNTLIKQMRSLILAYVKLPSSSARPENTTHLTKADLKI
jgi:hypothetical protein